MSNDEQDTGSQHDDGSDDGGLEDLEDLPYVGPTKAETLREAGFEDVADVRAAAESDLASVEGFGSALAAQVKVGLAELDEEGAGPDADEEPTESEVAETTMAEGGDESGRTDDSADADEEHDTMGNDTTEDTDEPATPSTGAAEGGSIDTSLQVSDDGNVIEAEPVGDDSVGERLLDNIDGLRSTLENASKEGGKVEAQIRQLQNEVSDLQAYKHAIEDFLEENGTGQQVINDVQAEMDSLEDDLRELREVARNHARVLSGLRDNYGTIAGRLEDQETAITDVRGTLDEHALDIDAVDSDVDDVRAELEAHRTEADERLETHESDIGALQDAVDANEGAIESTADDLSALSNDLESLQETAENRLDDHEDQLDAVDTTLDEQDDELTEVRHELDGATEDVAALESALDEQVSGLEADLDDQVTRLETDLDDQVTSLEADLDERVSGLEADVDEQFADAADDREDIESAVEDNTETIEALSDRVDDVHRDVESLDDRLGETQSVDQRFADIEDEIEELRQWQEDLRNVMGGPAGLGGGGGSE